MYKILHLPEAIYLRGVKSDYWQPSGAFASIKKDLDSYRLWYDTFCDARLYGRGMIKINATIADITFDTEAVAKKFISMLCGADIKRRVEVLTFAGIYNGEYDFYAHRR
jgi:hypothetical protein